MPQVGDALGRYVLLKKLAVGGMGEIFLAAKTTPLGFAPPVALKVLREELASDQVFVDMLIDEANITKYLNHQNVVSVLDFGEDKRTYYIAMEYVQGITLKDFLTRSRELGKKPDLALTLYVGTELCRALKYAHTRVNHKGEPMHIVHRDVTPGNVLLSMQGEVKLTDFGIARAKGRIHQTQAGVLKGKFGYMAPEMVRYERIDARADLFCVGVVLYELATGRHPVENCTIMEAIERFDRGQIDPPSRVNRDVPERLDFVLKKALEPRSENRWDSASSLIQELQDLALKTKQGRDELKTAPRHLSEAIRQLFPSAFDPPVPKEVLDRLLAEARVREEREKKAPPKPAPAPVAPPPAQDDDRPFLFRPTVGDSAEGSADDGLSPIEDSIGPTLIPQAGQQSVGIPQPSVSADLRAIDDSFPDSSTDRSRIRDELLDEPALPGASGDQTMPLKAVRADVEERTVASADYESIRALEEQARAKKPATPDSGDDFPTFMRARDPAEPPADLLEEESLPAGTNLSAPTDTDDKTIAGLIPPEIVDDATLSIPKVTIQDPDAPIILGPGSKKPPQPQIVSQLASAVMEATSAPSSDGDATLMDGIKLSDIEKEKQKMAAERAGMFDEAPLERAPAPETGYSDDSTQAYIYEPELAHAIAQPAKLTGPLRIKVGDDGEPEKVGGKSKPEVKLEPSKSKPEMKLEPSKSKPEPMRTTKPIDPLAAKKASTMKVETSPAISAADDEAGKLLISTRNQATPAPASVVTPREATRSIPTRISQPPNPAPMPPPVSIPVAPPPPENYAPQGSGLGTKVMMGLAGLAMLIVLLYSQRVGWPSVELQSDPQGATVILDGDTLSQPTPLRATVKPFQQHEIRFTRKGYAPEVLEPVTLGLFDQTTKVVTLKRPRVPVNVAPVAAEVFVNGKSAAQGTKVEVTFDRDDGNLIEARAPGYAPWSVAFGPGEVPPGAVDVFLSALPTGTPP